MENASKALLMAASILMGVMIATVAVALFNSFGGFGKEIMTQIEAKQVSEFNAQFTKYYGEVFNEETNAYEKIKLTAHDVVTLVNLASKNNIEHEIQQQTRENENSYYIRILLREGNKEHKNFEKTTEEQLKNFVKERINTIKVITQNEEKIIDMDYYYVKDIKISKKTGRVNYVEIEKLPRINN